MNAYLFIIIHNLTNKELKSLHYKNIQFAIWLDLYWDLYIHCTG